MLSFFFRYSRLLPGFVASSLDRNYLYVSLPRSGSTSTIRTLAVNEAAQDSRVIVPDFNEEGFIGIQDVSSWHIFEDKILNIDLDRLRAKYIFSFVRNPYSRLLSSYYRGRAKGFFSMFCGVEQPRELSFEEFVEIVCAMDDHTHDVHIISQVRLLALEDWRYDFIGRVENYADDMTFVLHKLYGRSAIRNFYAEERTSAGRAAARAAAFTPRLADKVYVRFRKDFELLGYDPDPAKTEAVRPVALREGFSKYALLAWESQRALAQGNVALFEALTEAAHHECSPESEQCLLLCTAHGCVSADEGIRDISRYVELMAQSSKQNCATEWITTTKSLLYLPKVLNHVGMEYMLELLYIAWISPLEDRGLKACLLASLILLHIDARICISEENKDALFAEYFSLEDDAVMRVYIDGMLNFSKGNVIRGEDILTNLLANANDEMGIILHDLWKMRLKYEKVYSVHFDDILKNAGKKYFLNILPRIVEFYLEKDDAESANFVIDIYFKNRPYTADSLRILALVCLKTKRYSLFDKSIIALSRIYRERFVTLLSSAP